MLEVKNVSFAYPHEEQVLSNLNFSLNHEKILAIVGQSGSGKSTLLKLIYGLLEPHIGSILWNNEEIPKPKDVLIPGHQKMKLVEQDFNLMPYIRVYENIQQHILRLQESERKPLLDYWHAFLNIQHIETKKAKDLSGGQMQRVAIAKAFISNPDLLLLDEPFSNLDTMTKSTLVSDLKTVIKERKTSCIVVVHQPEDALALADEILVLDNGKIQQLATPEQVYHKPASKTVAQLFGVSNFFSKAEMENILKPVSSVYHTIEGNSLIRAQELSLKDIQAEYEVIGKLFTGPYSLLKVKAGN